jgi:hypothetical protein
MLSGQCFENQNTRLNEYTFVNRAFICKKIWLQFGKPFVLKFVMKILDGLNVYNTTNHLKQNQNHCAVSFLQPGLGSVRVWDQRCFVKNGV